jgi:hypothetical protein
MRGLLMVIKGSLRFELGRSKEGVARDDMVEN